MHAAVVLQLVRDSVAGVVGRVIHDDVPLMSAGLDSLAASEVFATLQSAMQMPMPATLVFDYPTISSIASFLQERSCYKRQRQRGHPGALHIAFGAESSPGHYSRCSHQRGSRATVVLVAGMSALPWSLLDPSIAADGVSTVPLSRWDAADPRVGTVGDNGRAAGMVALPAQFGAFVPGVELFDAVLYGVTPAEAATLDPQQRLLLRVALEAVPSGVSLSSLLGTEVGVFVGLTSNDYEAMGQRLGVQVRLLGV